MDSPEWFSFEEILHLFSTSSTNLCVFYCIQYYWFWFGELKLWLNYYARLSIWYNHKLFNYPLEYFEVKTKFDHLLLCQTHSHDPTRSTYSRAIFLLRSFTCPLNGQQKCLGPLTCSVYVKKMKPLVVFLFIWALYIR